MNIIEEMLITIDFSDMPETGKETITSIVDLEEPNVPLKEKQKTKVLEIIQEIYGLGKARQYMKASTWLSYLNKIESIYK